MQGDIEDLRSSVPPQVKFNSFSVHSIESFVSLAAVLKH